MTVAIVAAVWLALAAGVGLLLGAIIRHADEHAGLQ